MTELALLASPLSTKQVAEIIDRTEQSIRRQRHRMGLKPGKPPKAERERPARKTRPRYEPVPLPELERGARVRHIKSKREYRIATVRPDCVLIIGIWSMSAPLLTVDLERLRLKFEGIPE